MKVTDIIVLQAIGNALAKLDSSVDLGELEDEIIKAVAGLETLAAKNAQIKQLYETERRELKKLYQAQPKDKGFDPENDDSRDTDVGNVNPPSDKSENTNKSADEGEKS
ncbi:hypothetical protein [Microcoleus sp. FACHB-672]|uniref:hypothetical protein n=1 Tax=Microcoleus sp. FACHB-672 TaxID=2692825 RepID=UPI0016897D09|nr:hypothetical protein [Microcoleus sp. FACHB-672]MBD2041087.1 hypothetical protein [Microcoleus sp. FACHB-672]